VSVWLFCDVLRPECQNFDRRVNAVAMCVCNVSLLSTKVLSNRCCAAWQIVTTHKSEAGAHPSYGLRFKLKEAEVEAELTATFFNAPVDKTTRQLNVDGVKSFLEELKRNPNVATVHAFSDFPYTKNNSLRVPLIEREYWLKISRETLVNKKLAGKDGFIILHVHYSGEWRESDTQADFDRKRSIITQINGRHTWDDSRDLRERFFKKCLELDKWREAKGTPILGNREAPSGWKWRDDSSRRLTVDTPFLRDLLEKGEQCRKVVRTKYVELIAAHIEAPSLTFLDGSNTKIVGPQLMPAAKEETSCEGGMQKKDDMASGARTDGMGTDSEAKISAGAGSEAEFAVNNTYIRVRVHAAMFFTVQSAKDSSETVVA